MTALMVSLSPAENASYMLCYWLASIKEAFRNSMTVAP